MSGIVDTQAGGEECAKLLSGQLKGDYSAARYRSRCLERLATV